jgi:predicted DNA-binding transcriptional regulator AlpA
MMSSDNHRRLLRLRPAAVYLSMSCAVLRRLIQQGAIPRIQLTEHGPWLVDVEDLDNWIRKNKVDFS